MGRRRAPSHGRRPRPGPRPPVPGDAGSHRRTRHRHRPPSAAAGRRGLHRRRRGHRDRGRRPEPRGERSPHPDGERGDRVAGAAAEELKREKPLAPRDDQFVYSKEVIKQTPVSGGRSETYVDESWSSVDGSKKSYVSELGHTQWVPADRPGQGTWPPSRWSELKQLPLQPGRLTITLRDMGGKPEYGRPTKADEWPMVQYFLSGLLRRPVLPKGLRSAAFEALAGVPGIKVLPGRIEVEGRAAVGVLYKGPAGSSWGSGRFLLFDAKTYQYLGVRERATVNGTAYEQWSYLAASAVVDRVFQRP